MGDRIDRLAAVVRAGGTEHRTGTGHALVTDPATSDPLLERLRSAFPDSSGRQLRRWLEAGRIRVNDRVVRDGRVPVRPEDAVALAPRAEPVFPAPLRRVHEDDALLVVEKPAGLLTIATERERGRTAYRLLWDYLAGGRPRGRPFVVHRLDRETSGLLLVAKSPAAKRDLQSQFEARAVERVYVAVVEGIVEPDRGTLESRLREGPRLAVRPARRGGRVAITRFRVLERRGHATLLELALETGRRHQIRVQLAAMGHPVVGDRVHGRRRDPLRRLCLHAIRLGFRHPATGAFVRFESAPPPGFARVGR
jgi:23S rRNA pseudouridine1911/1915/1917 synthase